MISHEAIVKGKCLSAGWDHLDNPGHYWEATVGNNCWEGANCKKTWSTSGNPLS